MPELDGFGVLEAVGTERLPVIVFVTAHDKFALKAFDVHAVDYLLKPFDRERFQKALQRARDQIAHRQSCNVSQRMAALLADLKPAQRFAVKSNRPLRLLNLDAL